MDNKLKLIKYSIHGIFTIAILLFGIYLMQPPKEIEILSMPGEGLFNFASNDYITIVDKNKDGKIYGGFIEGNSGIIFLRKLLGDAKDPIKRGKILMELNNQEKLNNEAFTKGFFIFLGFLGLGNLLIKLAFNGYKNPTEINVTEPNKENPLIVNDLSEKSIYELIEEGKCPKCGKFLVKGYIEDGSYEDKCSYCQISVKKMLANCIK